jgi:hypothetical protein
MKKTESKTENKVILSLEDVPIDKTWLAKEARMSRGHLYHSMKYGFTKKSAKKVREVLQDLGVDLLKCKIPVRVLRAYKEDYQPEEEED